MFGGLHGPGAWVYVLPVLGEAKAERASTPPQGTTRPPHPGYTTIPGTVMTEHAVRHGVPNSAMGSK